MINWVKPALIGLGLLTTCAQADWFEQEPLRGAADLRYGAALYEFYQDRNLQALTELMVAQARGGIRGHGDNPEIMTGGFYMAYGMENAAANIFERLLDSNRPVRTQDAAWFYLSRMRYMGGNLEGARQALSHLSETQHQSIANDVKVLRFNLALASNQLDQAQTFLTDTDLMRSDWMPYLLFNIGAGYSRAKQWPEGAKYFSKLTSISQRSDEHLALYDKAMTAEGYSHLFNSDYNRAIEGFKKVRLNSPLASRALLGYGWAAYEQKNYTLALKPWQALATRPLADANVQESWVAIAVAYERLGYKSTALVQYRAAEKAYVDEIKRLDKTLLNIQGTAIRAALNVNQSQDFNLFDYAAKNQMEPELVYLVNLFSKNPFLSAVQNLKDLLAIEQNLAQWAAKLNLYTGMLNEREQNRNQQIDKNTLQTLGLKIADLVKQSDNFRRRIDDLESGTNFLQLVSISDGKRRERIVRAEANVALLQNSARQGAAVMAPEELNQLAETTRIHKGVLTWDAAIMQSERLARARQQLQQVDAQLDKIQNVSGRVRNIAEQGFDIKPYRTRMNAARQTVEAQTLNVKAEIEKAQNALRTKIRLALSLERERLTEYVSQARISAARLLDASVEPERNPAASPDTATEVDSQEQASEKNTAAEAAAPRLEPESNLIRRPGGTTNTTNSEGKRL